MTDKDFRALDPIVPESEERIGRGQSKPSAKGDKKRGRRPAESSPARPSGGGLWKLLVLILIVGFAGLGYFFVQQTEQLAQLQGRFDTLEAKIDSTDESLNQSGTALSVKLKDHGEALDKHWAEIKKLWGIAYDRNRKAIESQEKRLAAQEKTMKGLQASMAARKKEVASVSKELEGVSKSLNTMVNTSMTAKLELNDVVSQSQAVTDQVASLKKSIDVLKQNLNSRVANNEEAIGAIDAYRLQVNRDIQQMKQQLGSIPVNSAP